MRALSSQKVEIHPLQSDTGANILSSLFRKKKIHGVYDIPAIMLYNRIVDKEMYTEDDKRVGAKDAIYGTFPFFALVEQFILNHYTDEYIMNASGNDAKEIFKEEVGYFRKRIAKELVYDVKPEAIDEGEMVITISSVSMLSKTIAENKIWKDDAIQENQPVFMQYVTGADPKRNGEEEDSVDFEIKSQNLHDEDELTKLEREARLKNIDSRYKKAVEKINLKKLKQYLLNEFEEPFQPQGRQKEMLANMKRFNFVSASRRCGKTFLSAYLASRQLMIPNQNIIYVVPELRNQGRTPWKYLLTMLGRNPAIKFTKDQWSIYHRGTNSEIFFLSGTRENSVRSSAANLLIFDEAAYLSETVYESASALVRTTNGIVYAITTPNIDTPKNWYYYKLIQAELARFDEQSRYYGKRITLRENPFIPDEEKEAIYKEGQTNMKIFNTEYMAQFHDSETFDLSRFWIVDYKPVEYNIAGQRYTKIRYDALSQEIAINPYNHFIISYDCAKKMDRPGVGVLGLHSEGANVVLADYMPNFDYVDQVKNVLSLQKLLGKNRCTIVLDYGGAGVVVEELFRREHKQSVACIQSVGGREARRVEGVWRVPKTLIIGRFTSAISRGVLKGFSFMDKLRLEFETYDNNQERTGGHHYDILMALANGAWYAHKYGKLVVEQKTTDEKNAEWLADGISEETDYYAQLGMSKRGDLTEERMSRFGY